VIDPGAEPERILTALGEGGLQCAAVLITHAHHDHIGAVAPVARGHGCPVYLSSGEAHMLRNLEEQDAPGFGPLESYEADVNLQGDERFSVAGLNIQTHSAPGHSPAGLVFEITDPESGQVALFVGDVIFRGSVGRTDFPGSSWEILEDSIVRLYESCPRDAPVLSGHSGPTTLEHELATNPFLDGVRARVGS
jgi:hydroxyacylglutathione hydrolase